MTDNSDIVPRPCPPALPTFHPRGDDVLPSSRAYCDAMMAAGVSCGNQWPDCQTNGAAWYQISGSQQDWEFHFHNVPMMTMEITQIKRPVRPAPTATHRLALRVTIPSLKAQSS